jgi:hypothetical protein
VLGAGGLESRRDVVEQRAAVAEDGDLAKALRDAGTRVDGDRVVHQAHENSAIRIEQRRLLGRRHETGDELDGLMPGVDTHEVERVVGRSLSATVEVEFGAVRRGHPLARRGQAEHPTGVRGVLEGNTPAREPQIGGIPVCGPVLADRLRDDCAVAADVVE